MKKQELIRKNNEKCEYSIKNLCKLIHKENNDYPECNGLDLMCGFNTYVFNLEQQAKQIRNAQDDGELYISGLKGKKYKV